MAIESRPWNSNCLGVALAVQRATERAVQSVADNQWRQDVAPLLRSIVDNVRRTGIGVVIRVESADGRRAVLTVSPDGMLVRDGQKYTIGEAFMSMDFDHVLRLLCEKHNSLTVEIW